MKVEGMALPFLQWLNFVGHTDWKKSIVYEDQKRRGGTKEKCVLCQVATWCQETKDRISKRQPLLMSGPKLYCEEA